MHVSTLAQLTKIKIRGSQVTDVALAHVATLPRLTSLFLYADDITFSAIAQLVNLDQGF